MQFLRLKFSVYLTGFNRWRQNWLFLIAKILAIGVQLSKWAGNGF